MALHTVFFPQKITHITTTAAGYIKNDWHHKVKRPERCICCGHGRLHRHGCYERFVVVDTRPQSLKIARFYCPRCRRTTSCLPSFALPYRLLPADLVQSWLSGCRSHAGAAQYQSLLESYHRYWESGRARQLFRMLGLALGRIDADKPGLSLFSALVSHWGDLAGASVGMLDSYGESLLGRYRIHDWARAPRNAVDGQRKVQWPDTG